MLSNKCKEIKLFPEYLCFFFPLQIMLDFLGCSLKLIFI